MANVIVATVVVVMITASFLIALQASSTARDLIRGRYQPWGYKQWQVADGLRQMGIQPGDKVAFIGDGFRNSWARLARVQIVAEMPPKEVNNFWAADNLTKSQVIKTFAKTGAVVIVTEALPSPVSATDWSRIGDTNYYAYILPKPVEQ